MELRIAPYQLPEKIEFNFEEIKGYLEEKTSEAASVFYSDEDIPKAKKDRAECNNLKKALNDERIRREKEYMKPFEEFKAQIKSLNAIIDTATVAIDKQIKEYEGNQKQEKLEKIKALWAEMDVPDGLTMDKVFEERMLNTTFSMKKVGTCFELAIGKFNRDMATLAALPEFGFEAQQVYISTFDLNQALAEGQRMAQIQKQKAEYEAEQARLKAEEEARKRQEQLEAQQEESAPLQCQIHFIDEKMPEVCISPEEERTWVNFSAYLTVEDAKVLKAFFNSRNIQFKAV